MNFNNAPLMVTHPKVTVIIPTYNRSELLSKAIESVLSQKNKDIVLHILDNASSDDTPLLLKNLQKTHSNILVTSRRTNIGSSANFVEGFQSVRSEYFIPLADDDELAPNFLTDALKVAESDKSLGAVIHSTEVRSNNRPVFISESPLVAGKYAPEIHIKSFLNHGHYISWSSILWRTNTLTDLDIKHVFDFFGLPSDVWFQFSVFMKYPVFITNNPGSIFTLHENQASNGIGLSSSTFTQVGRLLDSVHSTLTSSNLFSREEIISLMNTYTVWWNKSLLAKGYSAIPNSKDTHAMLLSYLQHFYPHAGFTHFPLSQVLLQLTPTLSPQNNEPPKTTRGTFLNITKKLVPPVLLDAIKWSIRHFGGFGRIFR